MTGSMRLTGEDLLVADTPEYRIQASPDLTVAADKDGYFVTGQVVIPSARISPKDLSTSVGTSPDERIVGAAGRGAEPPDHAPGPCAACAWRSATTCASTATGSRRTSAARSW